jgi:hypothetical protein
MRIRKRNFIPQGSSHVARISFRRNLITEVPCQSLHIQRAINFAELDKTYYCRRHRLTNQSHPEGTGCRHRKDRQAWIQRERTM